MKDKQFKGICSIYKVFPDECSAHEYLASERWGDGVVQCPHCEHEHVYVFKDGIRYDCRECKKQFTAKTGTFMEASKLPTVKWIYAMYLILHKKGISSVQLAKDIEVTQKTAWFVLHRIRVAFGNEDEQKLEGVIQLDETFVGGKNKNRHADKKVENSQGRSFKDKTPIMGMLQQEVSTIIERPHKIIPCRTVKEKIVITPDRLICKVVKNTKQTSLQPIIRNSVAKGSILVSDEWFGYDGLNNAYNHQIVDHRRKQYVNELGYTSNALECRWKELKLTIQATYVRPTRKHLDKYKSEFVFKMNNRNLDVQQKINCIIRNMNCRLKYKDLIAA